MPMVRILVQNQFGTFKTAFHDKVDESVDRLHRLFTDDESLTHLTFIDDTGIKRYFRGPLLEMSVISMETQDEQG